MDLEHLTKHQIVLLTLLVSFVTSIATGIVTVSLINQAPPPLTRTINQLVEHTVEKVVQATPVMSAVVTTEKTVVVKDDDLAAQSIAKMQKSIVRIAAKGGDLLLTRGVIVSANGTAIADRGALMADDATSFEAILSDGKRYPAVLRPAATSSQSVAVLDIAGGPSTAFSPASFASAGKVQLGQSVIRIGGVGGDTGGPGGVASLPSDSHPDLIEASVVSSTPGSVLMTLFGEVVGIITVDSAAQGGDYYTIPNQSLLVSSPTPLKKSSP